MQFSRRDGKEAFTGDTQETAANFTLTAFPVSPIQLSLPSRLLIVFLFEIFYRSARSRITSPARIMPITGGTKERLPGKCLPFSTITSRVSIGGSVE